MATKQRSRKAKAKIHDSVQLLTAGKFACHRFCDLEVVPGRYAWRKLCNSEYGLATMLMNLTALVPIVSMVPSELL